jgi:hypothetical protein
MQPPENHGYITQPPKLTFDALFNHDCSSERPTSLSILLPLPKLHTAQSSTDTMIEQTPRLKEKKKPFIESFMEFPLGYPRLSERIALKPETGIYRRFDALNARNILYLQAELCALERDLRLSEKEDNRDHIGNRSQYALDFEDMLEDSEKQQVPQLVLIEKIRKKLNQYSKYHT